MSSLLISSSTCSCVTTSVCLFVLAQTDSWIHLHLRLPPVQHISPDIPSHILQTRIGYIIPPSVLRVCPGVSYQLDMSRIPRNRQAADLSVAAEESQPATVLIQFYAVFMEFIFTSSITVCYSAATKLDTQRLRCIIRSTEKIIGCQPLTTDQLHDSWSMRKKT